MLISEPFILSLLSDLYYDTKLHKIIICKDESQAQKIHKDILILSNDFIASDNILVLPGFIQTGIFKYESAKKIIAQRLSVSHSLATCTPRIIIASVSGFTRSFPSVSWTQQSSLCLNIGQNYDFETFISDLNYRVYNEVKQVEDVGEYTVKGCIIDVWPPGQHTPVRLEFSDNTLEKIKLFRVHDQKSFSVLNSVNILPAREFVWPKDNQLDIQLEILNDHILKQRVEGLNRSNLLEDFKSKIPFPGIDDLSYMFSKSFNSFLNEFKKQISKYADAKFEIDFFASYDDIQKELMNIENIYLSAWQGGASKNTLVGKLDSIFLGLPEFKNSLLASTSNFNLISEKQKKYTPPIEVTESFCFGSDKNLQQHKRTFHDRVIDLKSFLQKNIVQTIMISGKNQNSVIEILGLLTKYFPEIGSSVYNKISEFKFTESIIKSKNDHCESNIISKNIDLESSNDSPIFAEILDIDGLFFLQASKTLFISENLLRGRTLNTQFEDFSQTDLKPDSPSKSAYNSQIFFASQFSDFSEGDVVVHVQHGICRFRGLATIKVAGIVNDFLALEFSENDKIYLPVSKLNLIQKYIGSSASVQLDSLKTKAWEKRKEKAQKDVEHLAKQLLEHHAKQVITPGTAFSKIGEDYVEFEDAFPYEDTPDQQKATQDIMNDMSLPKAMDRLLCGDVGFGKTEVAMRACYRAVLDGKQVAWLVPTTVLAHQHLRTLVERMTPFGVNVCLFDRSSHTTAKNLTKLKNGEIDIVIGTHRLLAHDIKFKDLGLLVVDEEQHFGVMQKEKIKSMSYGIDVLTLTATPIPRTLQMALLGIRDLSLLTTPPKSRLATKTFVCPFEDKIIVDAIQFEIARGGQIFFVHNRVEELESVKTYLSGFLPNLRIAIGHGKMSQNDLEKTVVQFLNGDFDLFLCTTIVEAGIDMPNVNTIIVQNADFLGLAQLYQLRGRVGRRSTRGYAYFLVSSDRFNQKTDGMKRLDILKDHQELGSGFVIASQDLEMRGSGDILGDEQSGRVSEMGLETYLQMLDDAIKSLNGIRVTRKADVDLHIPLTLQIPEFYIENTRDRLLMYRRFFGARDEVVLTNLIQECEDRFGKLPEEVEDLAEISRIRRLLLIFGAVSFIVGDDNTECKLDQTLLQSTEDNAESFVKRILDLCNRQSKNVRLTNDGRLIFNIKQKQFVQNKKSTLLEVKKLLGVLAGV